jgi:hypothetical protein
MKPRLKKSKEGQVENASSKEAFWQSELVPGVKMVSETCTK